ncbi:MAG: M23 family metallopeptidase [Trueperaceae bacterium]|nr:M23 family metallopeptidase [Trueperaceae bacterium]
MKRLLILFVIVSTVFAFGQNAAQTYEVQPGDTLYRIATRFGLSVSELVSLNNLTNPDYLEVGQVLTIAIDLDWPDTLPSPLSAVSLSPENGIQGRALTLSVDLSEAATLEATFLGDRYRFGTTASGGQAILAVPVLQNPGVFPIELRATRADGRVASVSLPVRVFAGEYRREQIQLSPSTAALLEPTVVANELALIADICSPFEPEKLWRGAFSYPVTNPEFTSLFGTLRSYNGGPYRNFHRGLDLRGNSSTPIYAPANGVVVYAGDLQVRGGTVMLRHGLGVCSTYNHLSSISVEEGQTVPAGTLLGYAGATGLVTGPHLHWEIRVLNEPVNPLQWIEQPVGAD